MTAPASVSAEEGLHRLSEARAAAIRAQPYMREAVQALRPVRAEEVPTLGVDAGWRMYWNPGFVGKTAVDELAAVLLHEAWHLLRHHLRRREALNAEPALWNACAADPEINDDLRQLPSGLRLPEGCMYPETFGLQPGKLAEEYYEQARVMAREFLAASGGGGRCGSGSGGEPLPGEVAAEVRARAEGRLPEGVSPARAEVIARRTAEEADRHRRAKGRGSLPAGVDRWVDATLKPATIPWTRVLASAVRGALRRAGAADFTFSRPSRRAQACPQAVLPALRAPKPDVAVVVDTSGSVSDAMLSEALGEVRGLLREADARILSCDAAVHTVRRVWGVREAARCLVGGGGTDMGAGLLAAALLHPRPQVTVVLTDGETPWPDTNPGCGRVVAAILHGGDGVAPYVMQAVPAWAVAIPVPVTAEE